MLPSQYIHHYSTHAETINQRLVEFAAVPVAEYLWELMYCLLTPQSRAVNAGRVIEELKRRDFLAERFDPTSVLRDPYCYIRFHNQKSKRLLAVAEREEGIVEMLTSAMMPTQKREWLVKNINGLGWKEASHFLRNIGYRELAIIDRHILKHLLHCGAIDAIPASISNRRTYLDLESRFQKLADDSGLQLQQLDLLFWSFEEGSVRK